MDRHVAAAAIVGLAAFVIAAPAFAFPIAAPGTECLRLFVASTDPIIATYQGNSAAYSNDLYLGLDDSGQPANDGNLGNDLFIFNNHGSPVGRATILGSFPVGTELTFRLHVNNTGYNYYTGGAPLNPDAHCHARAQANWTSGVTLVSFEDLFNGPFAYNDLSFSFTNTVSSRISLLPTTATNPVGTTHTVTATLEDSTGGVLVGAAVTFTIVSGPNAGASGTCAARPDCTTDDVGQVSFTYDGSGGVGTDSLIACFTDVGGAPMCSQPVTKLWTSTGCPDGEACDDGDPCTASDLCTGGACHGTPVVCAPSDPCHLSGTCDPGTGLCSNPPAGDGTMCTDGDMCTQSDSCQAAVCTSGEPVVCPIPGECLVGGNCDPTTGVCSDPTPMANGTPCGSGGDCWDGDCNYPPSCGATVPTTSSLWPPDHGFVGVSVLGVIDPDGDPITISMAAISQDEAVGMVGTGNTCPDGLGLGSPTASLRAERSGTGDGRVYHVSYSASDGRGGSCTGAFAVCVPHDQSPLGACLDGGSSYDSTGPCTSLPSRATDPLPAPKSKTPISGERP